MPDVRVLWGSGLRSVLERPLRPRHTLQFGTHFIDPTCRPATTAGAAYHSPADGATTSNPTSNAAHNSTTRNATDNAAANHTCTSATGGAANPRTALWRAAAAVLHHRRGLPWRTLLCQLHLPSLWGQRSALLRRQCMQHKWRRMHRERVHLICSSYPIPFHSSSDSSSISAGAITPSAIHTTTNPNTNSNAYTTTNTTAACSTDCMWRLVPAMLHHRRGLPWGTVLRQLYLPSLWRQRSALLRGQCMHGGRQQMHWGCLHLKSSSDWMPDIDVCQWRTAQP